MELTSPATAVVIAFPLLMMFVMLGMNAVEQRLTRPRPTLQLVPGGEASGSLPADEPLEAVEVLASPADPRADVAATVLAAPGVPSTALPTTALTTIPALATTATLPNVALPTGTAEPTGGEHRPPPLRLVTAASHPGRGTRARTALRAIATADSSCSSQ